MDNQHPTNAEFPRVLPGELCVNRRHTHGNQAYKEACLDENVPPFPLIHRATGAAALGIVIAVCAAAAAIYRYWQ